MALGASRDLPEEAPAWSSGATSKASILYQNLDRRARLDTRGLITRDFAAKDRPCFLCDLRGLNLRKLHVDGIFSKCDFREGMTRTRGTK